MTSQVELLDPLDMGVVLLSYHDKEVEPSTIPTFSENFKIW